MVKNMRGVAVALLVVAVHMVTAVLAAGKTDEKLADSTETPELFLELPELTVTAGTMWRFAEVKGFQILSSASDKASTNFLAEFLHEVNLCRVMLPGDILPQPSSPTILILHSGSAPGANVRGGWTGAAMSDRTDFDLTTFVVNVDWFETHGFSPGDSGNLRLSTTGNYLQWLLDCRQPRLPRWFTEGLRLLMTGQIFGPKTVSISGYAVLTEGGFKQMIISTQKPLEHIFVDEAPKESEKAFGDWRRLACEFLLWGLASSAHRERFFNFVRRASVEGVPEKLFEECLGMNLKDGGTAVVRMLMRIQQRNEKNQMPLSMEADKGRSEMEPVVFRPAKSAEIARSIGEWRRQNAMLIEDAGERKKILGDVRTMMTSHVRKDRPVDHALVADLALCELALGETESARTHLETACSDSSVRARASFELAKLRFADAKRLPEGREGKLSAAQVEAVAKPLRMALGKVPVSAGAYRLLVELWRNSEEAPGEADMALLLKGQVLFPAKPSSQSGS